MNMKGIMIRLQDFTTGGHFREFELDVYNRNAGETQLRKQFLQLMKRKDIAYYYQPIIISLLYRRLQVRSELWKH